MDRPFLSHQLMARAGDDWGSAVIWTPLPSPAGTTAASQPVSHPDRGRK